MYCDRELKTQIAANAALGYRIAFYASHHPIHLRSEPETYNAANTVQVRSKDDLEISAHTNISRGFQNKQSHTLCRYLANFTYISTHKHAKLGNWGGGVYWRD